LLKTPTVNYNIINVITVNLKIVGKTLTDEWFYKQLEVGGE